MISFDQQIKAPWPLDLKALPQALEQLIVLEGQSCENLGFVLCNDEYVLNLNKEYLQHDYYTDILTFDLRDKNNEPLKAEVYISLDRVNENAQKLKVEPAEECLRVICHGVLHLLGHKDDSDNEKAKMRTLEEAWMDFILKKKIVSRGTS